MPNYERSYWKAVQYQEEVEQGKVKLYKKDIDTVLKMLREIANASWEKEAGFR